jgi:DNA-binding transcriptional LysR family regulator
MLDLGRLRVLRELKHRGTLDKVAEALAYSPSTISRQLAQLEKDVGVPLLLPDGRGVRLTTQAEVLIRHVERVLVVLDEAEAEIAASIEELRGEVRMAAFQTATIRLVPDAVEHLAQRHPDLRVRVRVLEPERSLPALRARDFDLVLTEQYPGHPAPVLPDVHVAMLTRDPLRLALPEGDHRTLSDLHDAAWVLEPPGTAARAWAEALCRHAGFEPDVHFEATDLRLHVDLVRRGQCVALLPDLAHEPGYPGLTLRDLPDAPQRLIHTNVRSGSRDHPALVACQRALSLTQPAGGDARGTARHGGPVSEGWGAGAARPPAS